MITLNGITLPEDLIWSDEFSWTAVRQGADYSLTGALMIDEATRLAGRPITLTDGWASRALVLQLYTLTQQAGQTHTLTINGTSYDVMFRQSEGPLSATPVKPVYAADFDDGDWYRLTLRFLVV
ncbi:hypothetical protein [Marinobacterium litorale]|uniref:hypothetical protein n=1 Tax=Marinobacterium litorale TaxID=404770 RepID=UPI000408A379|nr:hypothetical protein [Marinobacterium litorale]